MASQSCRWKLHYYVGSVVDARDEYGHWYDSVVTEVADDGLRVKVHFKGWHSRFDAWVSVQENIAPLWSKVGPWRAELKIYDRLEVNVQGLWYRGLVSFVSHDDGVVTVACTRNLKKYTFALDRCVL